MNYGHGGDIYAGEEIRLDFSISVNPMGLPAAARERASEALLTAHRYPDPECRGLRRQLAEYYGLPGQWFVFGNGAADVIFELARAVKPGRACLPAPGFSEYERALRSVGCAVDFFELRESEDFRLDAEGFFEQAKNAQMVFLCNPSNPTGRLEHLEPLAARLLERGIWLAVDECFLELAEGGKEFSLRQLLGKYDRLCILDGLTKSRAMAGLRLGYAVSANAGLREKIGEQSQPWKVSVVAQEAAAAALGDREYMEKSLRMIGAERERVTAALRGMGFKVYPSAANFILFRDTAASNSGGRPGSLGEALLARGILIRSCGNFRGLDGSYYRIGLKLPQENNILLDELGQIVAERDQSGTRQGENTQDAQRGGDPH